MMIIAICLSSNDGNRAIQSSPYQLSNKALEKPVRTLHPLFELFQNGRKD